MDPATSESEAVISHANPGRRRIMMGLMLVHDTGTVSVLDRALRRIIERLLRSSTGLEVRATTPPCSISVASDE